MQTKLQNTLFPRRVTAAPVPFGSMTGAGGAQFLDCSSLSYGPAERLAPWTALAYRALWLEAELRRYASPPANGTKPKRRRSVGFRPDRPHVLASDAPWAPDLAH